MNVSNPEFQRILLSEARSMASQSAEQVSQHYSSKLVLVLGTQRSGTTLLYLMLTAHPDLTGLDEDDAGFQLPEWLVMAVNGLFGKRTVYKLPTAVWQVGKLQQLYPHCRIVWITRHPFAVISSMRNLHFEEEKQNWLQRFGSRELARMVKMIPTMDQLKLDTLSDVEIGAHLWVAKQNMIPLYREADLSVTTIRDEDLVSDTEKVARNVLQALDLEWQPEVLRHHRYHGNDIHPGKTRGDKPVDASRAKPCLNLTSAEKSCILDICDATLPVFGYTAD